MGDLPLIPPHREAGDAGKVFEGQDIGDSSGATDGHDPADRKDNRPAAADTLEASERRGGVFRRS
jgi:hypothetical protein